MILKTSWILVIVLLSAAATTIRGDNFAEELGSHPTLSQWTIPDELTGTFGAYPNLLHVTDEHRQNFHPVIKFPKGKHVKLMDLKQAKGLASPAQVQRAKNWWIRRLVRPLRRVLKQGYALGAYDEDRKEMYSSEMFQDTSNQIDGYSGLRTLHLGIDLGGPAGSKVFAFEDGIVHSVGYNDEYGDYGYVIVIQHPLPSGVDIWALYGHLDKTTLQGKQAGTKIQKGQVIGRLGDCSENGGWQAPHVHFQLAMNAPETHDMPGAASVQDRSKALLDYPDPRYVLGPLY